MNVKSILLGTPRPVVAPTTKEVAGGAIKASTHSRLQNLKEYLGDLKPGQHAGKPLLLKGVKYENGEIVRGKNARVSAHKQSWLGSKRDKLLGRSDRDTLRAEAFKKDFKALAEGLLAKTKYKDTNVSSAALAFLKVLDSRDAGVTDSLREAVSNLVNALDKPAYNAGTRTENRPGRSNAVSTPKSGAEGAPVATTANTNERPPAAQALEIAKTLKGAYAAMTVNPDDATAAGAFSLAISAAYEQLYGNDALKAALVANLQNDRACLAAVDKGLALLDRQLLHPGVQPQAASKAEIPPRDLASMSAFDRAHVISKMSAAELEAQGVNATLDTFFREQAPGVNEAIKQARDRAVDENEVDDTGRLEAKELGDFARRNGFDLIAVLNTGVLEYLDTAEARLAFLSGVGASDADIKAILEAQIGAPGKGA